MINFGFSISKPRAIDIDRNNLRKSRENQGPASLGMTYFREER